MLLKNKVIIDIHTGEKVKFTKEETKKNKSLNNVSFGNNEKWGDIPEDDHQSDSDSKDSEYERYKRRKKEDKEFQFKKKGRNIFDCDKGEEAEEAYDYPDIQTLGEENYVLEFDYKKPRKTRKYAKTVMNEQEKKLDLSSNYEISNGRPESETSNSEICTEDRIRAYDPSIHSKKSKDTKNYIIENLHDIGEGDESSKNYNYGKNKISFEEEDKANKKYQENQRNQRDKDSWENEKYSLEADHTNSKNSYSKDMRNHSEREEDKSYEKEQDEIFVRRKKIKHVREPDEANTLQKYHSLNISISKSNMERIAAGENNNLDLNSVRSSNYCKSEEKLKEEDHNLAGKINIFSDLSKELNESKEGALSHTLDHDSLVKLRRVFGSEQLIRDYQTSEEQSHLHSMTHQEPDLLNDDFNGNNLQKEIMKEDLIKEHGLINNQNQENDTPFDLVYTPNGKIEENKKEDFMSTNELIKLFSSKEVNNELTSRDPESEEKGSHTVFDKNSFTDFRMNKIQEVLNNKDFDELKTLRKTAITNKASAEKKRLKNLHGEESPTTLKSKRLNLEKWVSKELKEIDEDNDEERFRKKTLMIICEQSISLLDVKHTEGNGSSQPSIIDRISDLTQGMKSLGSQSSSHKNIEIPDKRNIDDLLKTDSDAYSVEDSKSADDLYKDSHKGTSELVSPYNISSEKYILENKTDEEDNLEDTYELINEDFSKFRLNKNDQKSESSEAEEENKEKSGSVVTFKPNTIVTYNSDDQNSNGENEDIIDVFDNNEDQIISTEVNLNEQKIEESKFDKSNIDENTKISISENILGTLMREIQEFMFPPRVSPNTNIKNNLDSKLYDKPAFHLSPNPSINDNNNRSGQNEIQNNKIEIPGERIAEEVEGELDEDLNSERALNFSLIRNYEMKRTRADKNVYDTEVFWNYIDEVYEAINSRSELFMKAFSKPIQKDFLEWLTKLHYYGIMENIPENIEDSLLDSLDDQASILTIDLYLSLEKKREEENERISKHLL